MSEITDALTDIIKILADLVETVQTSDVDEDILILMKTCLRVSARSSGCALNKKEEDGLAEALFNRSHRVFCESQLASFVSFKSDFSGKSSSLGKRS
jgi:hypothetical protein